MIQNEKAKKIVDVIRDVVDDPDVQPGYPNANGDTNVTWCNRALNRMLVMLGGKAELLLEPRGINWTNANTMYRNAGNKCTEISGEKEAQERANAGDLVAVVAYNASGPGHVALVCPDEDEYSSQKGALIGQAGAKCGIMRVLNGFGRFPVKYFFIPYNNEGLSA